VKKRESLIAVSCLLAVAGGLALPGCSRPSAPGTAISSAASGDVGPTGVTFHWDTLQRKGKRGDNWCMTWADDDNLYTMMDDGTGWSEDGIKWGTTRAAPCT